MPRKKDVPVPAELLTLSDRLKYARGRTGMTATALAAKAEMDLSQVSRLEAGERSGGVEAATIIRLAHALGVPVGWLAADEGQLPPAAVFREETDRRRKASRGSSS